MRDVDFGAEKTLFFSALCRTSPLFVFKAGMESYSCKFFIFDKKFTLFLLKFTLLYVIIIKIDCKLSAISVYARARRET